MNEKNNKKEKQFLKVPEYPGGKKGLLDFIRSQLQYPADAFKDRIEGIVTIAFEVNDMGDVETAKVIKGLTPSCNEEALRVVKLLKYAKAYNHGIRLKSNHKVNIHFKLPQSQSVNIQFSYLSTDNNTSKQTENKEEYTYSITLPSDT
ncbi:MAG: energy transducer TonB [Bacteroidales bacterium]|jgi:protein TonB|nr:energy transducer TonB [Bacteroidales bacterium]MDD2687222.1 energy transducer TonB [Bacteroidales bacterium]MDD3330161.1 energy transducer TonB [Bacteroidales bacterium]MDD3691249.1 energy transducer TonB [Bacteroidales bacterium]MDD4044426.1 energy transducer TonB [Bacteroidales bacterium]